MTQARDGIKGFAAFVGGDGVLIGHEDLAVVVALHRRAAVVAAVVDAFGWALAPPAVDGVHLYGR